MAEHYIHNGEREKTIAALERAAAKASGKARRVIQGLAKALNPTTPAARGRNAKGDASMAKKRTATARKASSGKKSGFFSGKKTRTRTNPPSTLASKVKGMDLSGIAIEGAGVAAGSLALSFVDRQVEKFLPNVNPLIRTGLSTALVAGGTAYFSGGKGFLRSMAIGAVASGVTQVASEFMPSLFGGVEDEYAYGYDMGGWNPDGTWNEELGYAYEEDLGGILYDRTAAAPGSRSF